MNAASGPRPGWAPVRFGEDEVRPRHRLTWRHILACLLAFGIGVYGGLMLAAWFTG